MIPTGVEQMIITPDSVKLLIVKRTLESPPSSAAAGGGAGGGQFVPDGFGLVPFELNVDEERTLIQILQEAIGSNRIKVEDIYEYHILKQAKILTALLSLPHPAIEFAKSANDRTIDAAPPPPPSSSSSSAAASSSSSAASSSLELSGILNFKCIG